MIRPNPATHCQRMAAKLNGTTRRAIGRKLLLAVFMLWAGCASAATYYVDFADGDNNADGRSPRTAWKHAPGDPNAEGKPADVTLQPGDTIILKGGVAYHGEIRLDVSGTADEPITLDGNTAGEFGDGRAILDGGRPVTNWQRVESAQQVDGNPRWQEIFYADIDLDISGNVGHDRFVPHRKAPSSRQAPWQRVILTDGTHGLLPIAQLPKPSDPFYPDLPRDFHESPHRLEVRQDQDKTILKDPENLTADDPTYYEGMIIGIHGGNNHVYFAPVKEYDPDGHRLVLPHFSPSTYEQTRYALYNSVRLIDRPGEWAIVPLEDGRSRIYLLPDRREEGRPTDIGFPEFSTAVTIDSGASHLRIQGLLIQRYSGGDGGISISRSRTRSRDITITDCEIRFVSGHAGIGPHYADQINIRNVSIHQNPGWTTGIFLNRVNDFQVRDCRLDKNSGSGIRMYECGVGDIRDNTILDHFGMHASAVNVYEGCHDILLKRNYIQNTATINRNAEDIVFRNNVIDGLGKSAVGVGMWTSGRTGGRALKNIKFVNNTIVNFNPDVSWATGILGQRRNSPGSPEGLVIRGNILAGVAEDLPGQIENNIYTHTVEDRFLRGNRVVKDVNDLFMDPDNGDFRRRPGGPDMNAGADIPPPSPQ